MMNGCVMLYLQYQQTVVAKKRKRKNTLVTENSLLQLKFLYFLTFYNPTLFNLASIYISFQLFLVFFHDFASQPPQRAQWIQKTSAGALQPIRPLLRC